MHAVANESGAPAASIHVYSPPLSTMHHYEDTADAPLRVLHREQVAPDTVWGE